MSVDAFDDYKGRMQPAWWVSCGINTCTEEYMVLTSYMLGAKSKIRMAGWVQDTAGRWVCTKHAYMTKQVHEIARWENEGGR